jgi:hypothetical protein
MCRMGEVTPYLATPLNDGFNGIVNVTNSNSKTGRD